jgi:4-diphosphocytidyl-2-C-methyl-D-erythritol kinase
VRRAPAAAKINLALVVGPRRPDGRHELLTVYQRVGLADRLVVFRSPELRVDGFAADTIVRRALERIGEGNDSPFSARIVKRIPVAAGLGGGSSDAATALRLANGLRDAPLPDDELTAVARELGADVPYFLRDGPQLGAADGTELEPIDLPQDYWVVLIAPRGVSKRSTAEIYGAFDARNGEQGFEARRRALLAGLAHVRRPRDLAGLPANDLVTSPLAADLRALGAFRADVTGAGPTVYGLFLHGEQARAAQKAMAKNGRSWLTVPAWYR